MKDIQAKHISDLDFLRVVDEKSHDGRWAPISERWVLLHEIEEAMPDWPWKVLLAKARSLMKRGLMTGCGCGCRGDFEITDTGKELLHEMGGKVEVR